MKAKILVIFTVLILASAGLMFFSTVKKSGKIFSPIAENKKITPGKKPPPAKKREFQDPSGFKFSYPDNLTLNSPEKLSENYYSSLELSDKNKEGKITIDLTSTKFKTLAEWLKTNQTIAKGYKKSTLADLDSLEIKENDKLTVLAVDVETLISIVATYPKANQEFWLNATKSITSSFAFALPEKTQQSAVESSGSSSSDDSGIIFEGEEIVQ